MSHRAERISITALRVWLPDAKSETWVPGPTSAISAFTKHLPTHLGTETRVPVSYIQVDDVAGCKILRYERSKSWNRSDPETSGDGTQWWIFGPVVSNGSACFGNFCKEPQET